jgi:hypothetical protein
MPAKETSCIATIEQRLEREKEDFLSAGTDDVDLAEEDIDVEAVDEEDFFELDEEDDEDETQDIDETRDFSRTLIKGCVAVATMVCKLCSPYS